MFDINVGPLLGTYPWDSQSFHFEGPVPADTWEDLCINEELQFDLMLIALDDGIEAIIKNLSAEVLYEGNASPVEIAEVSRTFKSTFDATAPDDINFINMHGATIDLGKVLREEMLMQVL